MPAIFKKTALFLSLILLPFSAFAEEAPAHIEGATTINVDEAYALFENNVVFVDVRKQSDFESGRIPGAIHLDVKSAFTPENLAKAVQPSDPVVIYCNGFSCLRSSEATAKAVAWGYTNVKYLREGFPSWDEAGFPVE
ncbi:rhodanese-like domain-containing protein [Shimia sp. R10_1]|uniref:rhodanese-like domain-containing protein n=1 Tax=Shimia sp. R10_1 TaxID=2821095 RepID=UPI001AD99406|nr:rhodanese-like domain-containing protein [Shimia sp. R10_1]MBO9475475.1 rhodanese-like domain-containing protein [Shimia sp. R10_1]